MADFIKKPCLLAGLLITLNHVNPSVSMAQNRSDVEDAAFHDRDGNKCLTLDEAESMRFHLRRQSASARGYALLQRINALLPEIEKQGCISVAHINDTGVPDRETRKRDQVFFLRASFFDLNALDCQQRQPNAKPASFSFTDDFEGAVTKVALDGVLAMTLVEPGTYAGGDFLIDTVLLAFAEGEGQFSSTTQSRGYTRFGLNSELEIVGGAFESQFLELAGYWQSDMEFAASAYGGTLTWTPQQSQWKLGGYIAPPKQENYTYWLLDAKLDWFYVDNSGVTKLASGTNYVWLGSHIGLRSHFGSERLPNGIDLTMDANYFRDLISDENAYAFKTGMNFNLVPSKAAAVGIEYGYGKSQATLERESEVTVGLKLKY